MRPGTLQFVVLLSCVASAAVLAGRVGPEELSSTSSSTAVLQDSTGAHAAGHPSTVAPAQEDDGKKKGPIDFEDQDPDVKSHWALLVAGSSGWFNYRHQADVFHAYQVLLAGGYRRDHIVVMAADDIAQDPENPMPGKVFNKPGGPNVYEGVRIDYRGTDVTAENFLSVLLGDAKAMAGKGTGRVVDSGPRDKVFVFYSDHGAAGVLGMPNGPFLYADEFIKTLRKKHSRKGFKEAVLYIEACESGSMFEGLLGNDMDTYVTTAANAIESSWATYCPTFYSSGSSDSSSSGIQGLVITNGGSSDSNIDSLAAAAAAATATASSSSGWWKQGVFGVLSWLQQLLAKLTGAPQLPTPASTPAATSPAAGAAAGGVDPAPQFTTCLGDLYSVAWMEDAEVSDLTDETLLQQYKKIKVRTSQNFTYDQGSHVMQYGDLDIDRELAGDYEGMAHNGSSPSPSSFVSQDWLDFAAAAAAAAADAAGGSAGAGGADAAAVLVQQQHGSSSRRGLRHASRHRSSSAHSASPRSALHSSSHKASALQRDADLVPLAFTARHSSCPFKRAAAQQRLHAELHARKALDATARAAVAELLRQPGTGYVMMTNLGLAREHAAPHYNQQQQQHMHEPLLLAVSNVQSAAAASNAAAAAAAVLPVAEAHVDALMGPLPGREGQALVGDWQCLRGMVQAWEVSCAPLDQYGMKLTRLFANLCNAGLAPQQLQHTLAAGPCGNKP